MRLFANLSLRQKLTLISLGPAMAGLLLFIGLSMADDRQIYRNMLRNDLSRAAHMLAFNSAALLEFEDQLEGAKLLEAAAVYSEIDYACILDAQGEVFSQFARAEPGRATAPPLRATGAYFERDGVSVYYPILHGGVPLGTVYLHATLESYDQRVRRKAFTIGLLLLLAASLTVLFALRAQRLIYDPIVQLAGAARTISRTNDFSLRVVRESNDEIGDLVEQFNRMMARVQEKNSALRSEILVRQAAEQQIAASNEELHFEINQRAQAEEQRGALLADLERKNAELQDFAYIVSHDLKAPLRGINSLASWLADDYGDVLDDRGRRYLDQLRDRTRRMHNLIEGILRYSRLGRAELSPELLESRAIVAQVIETLAPPENIAVEIAGHLPPVYYDRIMLLQVFQNLIGNALQHLAKPAGTVTIACRAGVGEWEFSVHDDGVGIEGRHFDRIFRIFQSLKPRENETSGIGLALVKKIVERNHGRIEVDSEPGVGTTFRFTVPMQQNAPGPHESLNILVLDPNQDCANATRKLLEHGGHHVSMATTWPAAEELLAREGAVLDILLWDPENLGEDTARLEEASARFPSGIRVIACTSSGTGMEWPGALRKPLTLEKLASALASGPAMLEREGD